MGVIRNILLTLSYDGTGYHGWQVQENAVTVQQTFQDAWEHICGKRDNVIGCSRTDSGVHANMFCCNVRTQSMMDCGKLLTALNAVLPDDIAVTAVKEVPFEFHARYDCTGKEYIYIIRNSAVPSPFTNRFSWLIKPELDVELMNTAAAAFAGTHDFSAFCASGSSVEDTVRTVSLAEVTRKGDEVIFRVRANGFLYNMVRIMTGTLVDVSRGKLGAAMLPQIIASRNRENAGVTAPPQGLFLNRVFYGGDED